MSEATGQPACLDAPTALFFDDDPYSDLTLEAQRICAGCTLIDRCLDRALELEQPDEDGETFVYGVRGGLTAPDRRMLLFGVTPASDDEAA